MEPVPRYSFRLFVAPASLLSSVAEATLRALCEAMVPGDYALEVIDVFERPDLAEQEHVLATPTTVRLTPPPRRRVTGDLSDRRLATLALDFPAPPGPSAEGARS